MSVDQGVAQRPVMTEPGGPLKPKRTFRQHATRLIGSILIMLVLVAWVGHIDVLGMLTGYVWKSVHPDASPTPIADQTSPPDGTLQAAVNAITGNTPAPQPTRAALTPAPSSTAASRSTAPGVNGAATGAGLTPDAMAQMAAANAALSKIENPGADQQDQALGNLTRSMVQRDHEKQQQLARGDSSNVPTLTTPAPTATPGNNLTNNGASMLGVTPGQQSGALPASYDQLMRAAQASFVDANDDQQAQIYTSSSLQPARSADELWPTDEIPCIIKKELRSDLPGMAVCIVTQDVKSHLAPYHILIPASSEFWGPYNAIIGQGQERMQVRWNVLALPNGATLPLQSVQAEDTQGMAGISADVDKHVGRVYTSMLVGLVNNVAGGLVTARAVTGGIPSVGQLLGVAGYNAIQNQTQQATNTAQAQAWTLTVHAGSPVHISFAAIQTMPAYTLIARSYAPVIR